MYKKTIFTEKRERMVNDLNERNMPRGNDEAKEIDIASVFRMILSKWYWILICAVVLGAGLYCVANFGISPKYQSYVTLYVVNTNNNQQPSQSVNSGDLQASKGLAQTYTVILKSNTVLDAVVNEINTSANSQKLTRSELSGMIQVEAVNDSQLVKVTVTSTNADYACLIATAFGNAAPDQIIRITKAGSVELVDHAEVAKTPSSPKKTMFALVGAVVGAVVAVLFFLIKMITDTTIYLGEDLEKISNAPVLGLVPDTTGADLGDRRWKMIAGGVIVNEQIGKSN